MLNISTPTPFLSELEKSLSTDVHALYSRVSKCLIGPPQTRSTDGKSILTHVRLGITRCTICTLSGHHSNSQVNDWRAITHSNGSDLSNGDRVTVLVSSTTKSPNPLGTDTVVISTTPRKFCTPSPRLIRINRWSSVWTQPHQRVVSNSKRSGRPFAKWPLR